MIESGTKELVKRWLSKAESYANEELTSLNGRLSFSRGGKLEDSFDKFFSLYVAYNALYFEGTRYLLSQNIKIEGNGDKASATKNIPIYIGQKELYEELIKYKDDIKVIIESTDKFYFSTKRDNITPDFDKDKKLINKIKNSFNLTEIEKQKEFNVALLELIYYVRCNMFHGKKEFDEIQKDFLDSVSNVLKMIIEYMLNNK